MVQRALLTLSRRLRLVRNSMGVYDQKHFAELVGIEPDRYRKIEESKVEPTIEELAELSRVTGKSLDFLILGVSSTAAAAE